MNASTPDTAIRRETAVPPPDPAPNSSRHEDSLKAAHTAGPDGIDLTAALKLIGANVERTRWLTEMLQPGGLAPGATSSAHARAFRFAAALERAGYRVTEAPLGPRGGRRFVLDAYDGPRAGAIRRLQEHRGCGFEHSRNDCDCFDALTDAQIKQVTAIRRRLAKLWGPVYFTDSIATLVTNHDSDVIEVAVDLYYKSEPRSLSATRLEDLIAAIEAARM